MGCIGGRGIPDTGQHTLGHMIGIGIDQYPLFNHDQHDDQRASIFHTPAIEL